MKVISFLMFGFIICTFVAPTDAHADIICGEPTVEISTPDGNVAFDMYIAVNRENGDGGDTTYFSCWDGEVFSSATQTVYDYDHEWGWVCLEYNNQPEREYEYSDAFYGLPNCTISTTSYACNWHQYYDSDAQYCYPCPNDGDSGTGFNEDGQTPIYDGHFNAICSARMCTWQERFDNANNTCVQCPDNSSGTGYSRNDTTTPIQQLHHNQTCQCAGGFYMNSSNDNCVQCPPPGQTSASGATQIGQCMLIAGNAYSDDTGLYTMTNDCPYE